MTSRILLSIPYWTSIPVSLEDDWSYEFVDIDATTSAEQPFCQRGPQARPGQDQNDP